MNMISVQNKYAETNVVSHMHLLHFGDFLTRIDIKKCKTVDAIRDTIRREAKLRPDATRLLCKGWYQDVTDALASLLDDLDPRPIYIDAHDLHQTWCNTAALKELGVYECMKDPAGGEITRDKDGHATGLMSESAAVTIVWPFIAKAASQETRFTAIREALKSYAAAGYTTFADLATEEGSWQTLQDFRAQVEFPLRFAAYWIITPRDTDEEMLAQVDKAIEMHAKFNRQNSPDFYISGIKVICDGVIDGCTAALTEPYSHNGAQIEALWKQSSLLKVVRKASEAGLQCALHAIGDKAVKMAIDVLSSTGTKASRNRIEHLELTTAEDGRRLGEHGIIASVQPVHSDPAVLTAWPQLIGADRCKRIFAYGDFHAHGATLAFGTDSPTAPHLPFPNLYNATTRRSALEPEVEAKTTEQFKVGIFDAVTAATKGAAYALFADDRVGTIEVGKKADLVVVDMQWKPETLLQAVVHETWIDGKRVFRKET